MYANYTPKEFEEFWQNIVQEHDVGSNPWVLETYENKELWATAYLRETFFGRIRTTSQCEAINSLIKSYVKKKTTLVEFTHNFEQLLREYRNNEVIADFKSCFSEPVMTTSLKDIEREAARIYTHEIFKEVKKEIEISCALNVVRREEIGDILMIEVSHYCDAYTLVEVEFDRLCSVFSCACRRFESRGIPCRHIICVMKTEGIHIFPQSLICERWTKRSKTDIVSSIQPDEVDSDVLLTARFGALAAACNRLCSIAAKKTESFNEVRDEIVRLTLRIESGGGKCNTRVSNGVSDPTIVKTKGAPKQSKFERKRKRCSKCNYVGHTIRTCPNLRLKNKGGKDDVIPSDFTNAGQTFHGKEKGQQEISNGLENILPKDDAKSLHTGNFGMNDDRQGFESDQNLGQETIFRNEVIEVDNNDDIGSKYNDKRPLKDMCIEAKKSQKKRRKFAESVNMGKDLNENLKNAPSNSHVLPPPYNAIRNDFGALTYLYGTPFQMTHVPFLPPMLQFPLRPEVVGVDHNGRGKSFTSFLADVIQSGKDDEHS
ncbi:unnamed protein product [Cuscuta campestris]|uniref:Protein FAR1-RELATED SEQUENCE n=1 Tax=Cuscuta campestris TaxID=132261 RepID=A0A484KNV2_9ASTE|nr:unnamed protein product [Cuscuta campestris]